MPHPLELLDLDPLRRLTGTIERLVEGRLWAKVLLGLVLGVATGIVLGPSVGWVPPAVAAAIVSWLALPGTLFLALIQMIVVPLVFASVVRGLAAGGSMAELRQLGVGGGAYFLVTTAAATLLGLTLALVVQPGSYLNPAAVRAALGSGSAPVATGAAEIPGLEQLPDVLVGLIPTNPLAAMVGAQMLQVILFAVVIGVALVSLAPEKSAPLFDLLGSLQEVCMKVVGGAMRLAPFAVFGLMTRLTATVGADVLAGMGVYVLTVLVGMGLMLGVHGLLVGVIGGRNPLQFFRGIREVGLLAFSTSSSAAVMPLSIATAEDTLGVRPAVARFLVPLGATVNMNGTALYQGIATVFLAQIFEVPLSSSGLLFIIVMAVAASIGSPATPGTGIVILGMVLAGVGVPIEGLALLLGVDRVLDMTRTVVNVTGDLSACVVVDRFVAAEAQLESQTTSPDPQAEGQRSRVG
jgi:Na+/H+-dicarboxylate symporter